MPNRIKDAEGKILYIEFNLAEVAELLAVEPDRLERWSSAIPAAREVPGDRIYQVHSQDQLALWRKRALVLRTGMSEKQLAAIEREGVLPAYATLAVDCPEGLPLHVWRSYGVVVLMQVRYGIKIDAEELAKRAKLVDVDPTTRKKTLGVRMAQKHLDLLQWSAHVLTEIRPGMRVKVGDRVEVASEARWEHKGLPQAWHQGE
jgi:hypothetical protein